MINKKVFNQVHIAGIGVHIPPFRISVDTIAQVWKQDGKHVEQSLGVTQKSVAAKDEDSVTMAVSAASQAIEQSGIDKQMIGAIFVGSESHPYAVKPSGSIVGEWLGINPEYFCADLQFACKGGTAGIQIVAAMIEAGMIEAGLVIGSDKSQSKPGDALEYTAASCAVALVLTKQKGIAQIQATSSYSSDTPDFWRRPAQAYPEHAGRFSGEPAYFKHINESTKQFLNKVSKTIEAFDHVVFHMPNGKFPARIAKQLKVQSEKLKVGMTVSSIGNPYSASSLLGLARILNHGEKREEILMTSYGSGSGSDSFWITIEKKATKDQQNYFEKQLKQKIEVKYPQYLQMMGILGQTNT